MLRTLSSLLPIAFLLTFVFGPLAQSLRAQPVPPAPLPDLIEATLSHDDFSGATWGLAVIDLDAETPLYQHNRHSLFTPASNTKLFTTAAALEQLGPDYRFRTQVFTDGTMRDSILYGNLIVRGAGDPTIGGHEQKDAPLAVFRAWADSLREAGIRRVTGNLIGDDDLFTDTPLGYGWSWDDTPYYYAAEIGGLVFHENVIDLTIEPRSIGMPGRVRWAPLNTDYVTIVNQTKTIGASREKEEEYERTLGTNTIYLRTDLPQGRREKEALAVTNPTHYFTHVLKQVLTEEGITIDGQATDIDDLDPKPDYEDAAVRPVASYTSIPLARIVQTLNQESHNLYAEQVLRTLGVEHPVDSTEADPGSAEMGVEAAMRTYLRAGIDTSRVQFADGSGLSRHNLVTPDAITRLLTYMWNHPDAAVSSAFYRSLPIGGQNGTLEYRFRGREARAQGRVRAKTGTLSNTSALSGYVETTDGRPLAFVMLCNQHLAKTKAVRAAQDVIVNALVAEPLAP